MGLQKGGINLYKNLRYSPLVRRSSPSFNPTVVQLELFYYLLNRGRIFRFNPTVVQLERDCRSLWPFKISAFQSYCSPMRTIQRPPGLSRCWRVSILQYSN